MHAIVCFPLDTPTVVYLYHHRAASDVSKSDRQCHEFSENFQSVLQPMVGTCNSDPSCGCNMCLRHPPSLRNLSSHTVFHLTFNLSQFTLSDRTFYHQYPYDVESQTVSEEELVPLTVLIFSSLKCTFVLDKRCANSKRFHRDCVIPSERYCSTTYKIFFEGPEEAIATLCDDIDVWRCNFCTRPLFKTRDCLFF